MDIRPSAIAGTWYPAERTALQAMVAGFLKSARSPQVAGKIWGMIVPHAGFQYSGAVAANAFALLQGWAPAVIVVLSPYHDFHTAAFLTSAHKAYRTPFGVVEVHRQSLAAVDDALQARFGESLTPLVADREHSLEIQLPFLQHLVGDFQLIPIMLRTREAHMLQGLGLLLAQTLADREVLFVASSDLSHFYRQKEAHKLDTEVLHRIEAYDPAGVLSAEQEDVGYACGGAAIAAALWGAREMGANRVSLAGYATSGDLNGDYERVVGYGSAVIWQQDPGPSSKAQDLYQVESFAG